ncbi:hypothetical protein Tco_0041048 [Tanacetum coccineum]
MNFSRNRFCFLFIRVWRAPRTNAALGIVKSGISESGNEVITAQGRSSRTGGNRHDERDPRDVEIERLRQRVRELEINPFDRYERQYEDTSTDSTVEEYENEGSSTIFCRNSALTWCANGDLYFDRDVKFVAISGVHCGSYWGPKLILVVHTILSTVHEIPEVDAIEVLEDAILLLPLDLAPIGGMIGSVSAGRGTAWRQIKELQAQVLTETHPNACRQPQQAAALSWLLRCKETWPQQPLLGLLRRTHCPRVATFKDLEEKETTTVVINPLLGRMAEKQKMKECRPCSKSPTQPTCYIAQLNHEPLILVSANVMDRSIGIDIPVCLGLTLVRQTQFHLSQLRMSRVEHLHGLIYDDTC